MANSASEYFSTLVLSSKNANPAAITGTCGKKDNPSVADTKVCPKAPPNTSANNPTIQTHARKRSIAVESRAVALLGGAELITGRTRANSDVCSPSSNVMSPSRSSTSPAASSRPSQFSLTIPPDDLRTPNGTARNRDTNASTTKGAANKLLPTATTTSKHRLRRRPAPNTEGGVASMCQQPVACPLNVQYPAAEVAKTKT
mmetsp:Transcript_44430/g.100293  ORF Transcript_44430/g.100293 Transcript_44430/m.100293 type:complete len:201 (-) Transcript_44430:328-930(-)